MMCTTRLSLCSPAHILLKALLRLMTGFHDSKTATHKAQKGTLRGAVEACLEIKLQATALL